MGEHCLAARADGPCLGEREAGAHEVSARRDPGPGRSTSCIRARSLLLPLRDPADGRFQNPAWPSTVALGTLREGGEAGGPSGLRRSPCSFSEARALCTKASFKIRLDAPPPEETETEPERRLQA